MLHTHTHIYIYIRVCVCVCVTYAYIYACNISVCYTHTRKHIYIYIWAYYCVLFTFQKIGWGFGLAWQFIKNFPLKKTVGNVSRLALSCRASNFQERITDVKRVMAALCFKKSYVYSQCELWSVRVWGYKHCLLVEGNGVFLGRYLAIIIRSILHSSHGIVVHETFLYFYQSKQCSIAGDENHF